MKAASPQIPRPLSPLRPHPHHGNTPTSSFLHASHLYIFLIPPCSLRWPQSRPRCWPRSLSTSYTKGIGSTGRWRAGWWVGQDGGLARTADPLQWASALPDLHVTSINWALSRAHDIYQIWCKLTKGSFCALEHRKTDRQADGIIA